MSFQSTNLFQDGTKSAISNLPFAIRCLATIATIAGDTLRAETEILAKRESKSRAGQGIAMVRTRGLNQRDEVVIEFERSIMVPLA